MTCCACTLRFTAPTYDFCARAHARSLGSRQLSALLATCGASVRSLDLNGALGTVDLTEADLKKACPAVGQLDVRGRVRKH